MHRHIIHLLYVLILSYAVTAEIETVKMTVLYAHCNSKPCTNIELYYTTLGCFPKGPDHFADFLGNPKLDFTNREITLLPKDSLKLINDEKGQFVVKVNEGKISCCEDTTMRNTTYTDRTIHLQNYDSSHTHYSFDLRFRTVCPKNKYCNGFYCEDCNDPELKAWVDTHALVGGTTVLQCAVTASPGIRSIYWKLYNTTTQTYNTISNSDRLTGGNISVPSLTIRHVQIDDEGNYTCFAEKGRKTARSEPVYLNVIEVTTRVSMTTDDSTSETQVPMTTDDSTPETHVSFTTDVSTSETQVFMTTDVSTSENEASMTADVTTTGTFRSTAVSGSEKTKSVSSAVSSVINSTTSSMTTSSMTTGTSILSTTLLTSPSNLFTEQPEGNNTITTPPSSKSTFITTKSTVAVHIGDTNSRLNASSHPIKSESTASVKAWIGLTVALSVTEIILIVLIIYVIWLRKQTRSTKEKLKSLSCIDTQSTRMGSNWNGNTPSYRPDHLSYQGTLTSRAGDIWYEEMNPNHQRVSSNQDSDTLSDIVNGGKYSNKRQDMTQEEPLYSKINKINVPANTEVPAQPDSNKTNDVIHTSQSGQNKNISSSGTNPNKSEDISSKETCSDKLKDQISEDTIRNTQEDLLSKDIHAKEPKVSQLNEITSTSQDQTHL